MKSQNVKVMENAQNNEPVLMQETRECQDCKNFKQLYDGAICTEKLMAVHKNMKVGFMSDKGTCFESVTEESQEIITSYESLENEWQKSSLAAGLTFEEWLIKYFTIIRKNQIK